MKKLSLSIDLLKLQGAEKITAKNGDEYVAILIANSRAKPHTNGAVYLNLEAIENKDGENQWGKTHWVCEPSTKEERQQGVKLPIIGNGKEFGDMAEVKKKAASPPQPARRPPPPPADDDFGTGPISDGMEDDDIPF